mgnify:CR=1 FL=1
MKRLYLTGIARGRGADLRHGRQRGRQKELVFVVNGASDFWKIAEAGVKKAQDELPNYDLAVQISRAGRAPPSSSG